HRPHARLPIDVECGSASDRCCRKKILGGSLSNIDSKRAPKAQVRFKKSTPMIRLLRIRGMPRTFSTASTHCRPPTADLRRLAGDSLTPLRPPAVTISPSTARPTRRGASYRGGSCGGNGKRPLAAQAAAIQHKADEGVTHQQMITHQHHGESDYENGRKL